MLISIRSFGAGMAVAGLSVAGMFAASPASAATVTPSVSVAPVARLGLQGVSATLSVTYACAAGTAGLGGTIQQPAGHRRIASGIGWQYPVLCDGTVRTVGLLISGNTLTFRKGAATATATLQEQLPDGSVRNTTTGYVKVTLQR